MCLTTAPWALVRPGTDLQLFWKWLVRRALTIHWNGQWLGLFRDIFRDVSTHKNSAMLQRELYFCFAASTIFCCPNENPASQLQNQYWNGQWVRRALPIHWNGQWLGLLRDFEGTSKEL